ncbi:hypothetical protein ACYRFS_07535 [Listeria kieliensis]
MGIQISLKLHEKFTKYPCCFKRRCGILNKDIQINIYFQKGGSLLKKKWWWLLVVLVMIILGLLGGKMYMDNKKEQKTLDIEKQSVKVLKKTFVNIAKVKIERIGYNNMTGSYSIVVTMTNKQGQSAYFDYGFAENQKEISDYGIENEDVQKEGATSGKVKVIYSNGSGEEL